MRRKLTPREWMLLGVLAVLVMVAGYNVTISDGRDGGSTSVSGSIVYFECQP